MKLSRSYFKFSASLLLLAWTGSSMVLAQAQVPVSSVPTPAQAAAAQSQPASIAAGSNDAQVQPAVSNQPSPAQGVPGSPAAQSPAAAVIGVPVQPIPSAAVSSPPTDRPTVPAPPPTDKTNADLKIGAGDLIEVGVYGAADFNQTARVSESGDVVLPLIGQVHIADLTSQQAQVVLARKLADGNFYKHPQVTVYIKEYATQGVSVLGEVNKPGVYPRLGDRRLFDMISAAGGYTARAGTTVTITRRAQPNQPQTVAISNDPAKSQASNVEVYPGDTIVVSQAGIVYVVGDVSKPSGFAMQNNENMTVLQALAMAGGANPTAKLDNARLIRKNAIGMQETPMPLKKILQAKATDQTLQPGDILFVPASSGKNVAKRGLEAILQAATGVTIYHPW